MLGLRDGRSGTVSLSHDVESSNKDTDMKTQVISQRKDISSLQGQEPENRDPDMLMGVAPDG